MSGTSPKPYLDMRPQQTPHQQQVHKQTSVEVLRHIRQFVAILGECGILSTIRGSCKTGATHKNNCSVVISQLRGVSEFGSGLRSDECVLTSQCSHNLGFGVGIAFRGSRRFKCIL